MPFTSTVKKPEIFPLPVPEEKVPFVFPGNINKLLPDFNESPEIRLFKQTFFLLIQVDKGRDSIL
jgi:hypothetical protein